MFTKYIKLPNGKHTHRSKLLHELIMGKKKGYIIDHENRNSLDCRKENLRYSLVRENDKNRKGCNSNNKLGLRNICWIEKEQRYYVQLQVNGKNTLLGKFTKDDLELAKHFAEEMRQKHYKDFAGGK